MSLNLIIFINCSLHHIKLFYRIEEDLLFYVTLKNSDEVFTVDQKQYNKILVEKDSLRDRRIMKFEYVEVSEIDVVYNKRAFKFKHGTGDDWSVVVPRKLRFEQSEIFDLIIAAKEFVFTGEPLKELSQEYKEALTEPLLEMKIAAKEELMYDFKIVASPKEKDLYIVSLRNKEFSYLAKGNSVKKFTDVMKKLDNRAREK